MPQHLKNCQIIILLATEAILLTVVNKMTNIVHFKNLKVQYRSFET